MLVIIAEKPAITAQPKSVTAPMGKYVSVEVGAIGVGLTYQWQYLAPTGTAWADILTDDYDGANDWELVMPAMWHHNGYFYRCKVTDSAGNMVISEPAVLVMNSPLAIDAQPKDVTANVGDTAKFTVAARGMGLSYQWQYKLPYRKDWADAALTGNKTATLSVPVEAEYYEYSYRCVITDADGNTVTSSAAVLTIKPVITGQPQNVTASVGDIAEFRVCVMGAGLTCQWQYMAPDNWKWEKTSADRKATMLSIPVTPGRDGYQYRCRIEDEHGEVVYTNTAVLTVK